MDSQKILIFFSLVQWPFHVDDAVEIKAHLFWSKEMQVARNEDKKQIYHFIGHRLQEVNIYGIFLLFFL